MTLPTAAPRTLRMILNTFYSGPQAWFFVAADRGYLRAEGIELEFTEGDTAWNAVPRVADGEFEVGYGDMNALIELAATREVVDAIGVYATFTASPYTIAVPADSGVRTPADLAGMTLGAHPNDAAMRMWPELARAAGVATDAIGIDVSSLPHPRMLEALRAGRKWGGMFGFVNTLRAAAIEAGIDPSSLRHLEYRDFVPDLYGSVLLVSRRLAAAEPGLVAGLVRAINRGVADTIADVDAAVEAVARRNPRIDRVANRARLAGTLALEMSGAANGVGTVDAARLARAIDAIVAAKGFNRHPDPDHIFTDRFLPPAGARIHTAPRVAPDPS